MTATNSNRSTAVDERLPLWRRVRYRISETGVRAPIVWMRHRGIRPADLFLACYPRSGSTWLRFMLYELLTGDSAEFANVNAGMRVIGEHFHAPRILPGGGRFIGTHEKYRRVYHKVVYLVRDVRDVGLSQYRRELHMGVGANTLDDYLQTLMSGGKRHGSWHGHVLSYLDSELAKSDKFIIVRFEDLRRNTEDTLARILDFIGVPVGREAVRRSTENNSLAAMRAKEDRVHAQGVRVVRHPHRSSKEEGHFVHKGAIGGWRDKLTPEQLKLIEQYAGEALVRLGYPLTNYEPQLQRA